ncbi:MAG: hypothetical protein JNL88_01345 [Bacteroidia bacterium]|nr:hypothetical protein [Bacteroidia bacterium]
MKSKGVLKGSTTTALLFLLLLSTVPDGLFAQYSILTLRCDSLNLRCDTVSLEHYTAEKKLSRKIKYGNPAALIDYVYNSSGVLIRKEHRNPAGEIQKINKIYSDANGEWNLDSLQDKNGKTLFVFRRHPGERENTKIVEWFYKNDTLPSTRQLIQSDTMGNELSNSTCYSADNCVTYRFFYNGSRKLKAEMWVLDGTTNAPVLRETEEFYYTEGEFATGSVRFLEPEHLCTSRFRYVLINK